MDETTNNDQGFARFTKHMALGAVISGLLSAVPFLSCLNCLFCLLNMAGIVFALSMYLKAYPNDMVSAGESAGFGAAAGAGAGLIAGVAGLLVNVFFAGLVSSVLARIPGADTSELAQRMALQSAGSIIAIPLYMVLFSAFGTLGAFLGMKFIFKTRLRQA